MMIMSKCIVRGTLVPFVVSVLANSSQGCFRLIAHMAHVLPARVLGFNREVDPYKVIVDEKLSIRDGAISPWDVKNSNYYSQLMEGVSEVFEIDLDCPMARFNGC